MTELANAKTEAEVDAAAAKLNAQIAQNKDQNGNAGAVTRIIMLDELRGFCVLAMVLYHSFFVLATQFDVAWGQTLYEFFRPAQPVFAALFILISGFCARFSHDVRKRGLLLAVIAMAITAITVFLLPALGFKDTQVWFGVLHLLAASMLLCGFIGKIIVKIPAFLGVLLCLGLFLLTAPISQGYLGMFGLRFNLPEGLYQTNVLAFLGFYNKETFYSWDFFPLLPYLFIFLFGVYMSKIARSGGSGWVAVQMRDGKKIWDSRDNLPAFCYKPHSAFFGLLGRHALPIYLLHVPVFYGLFYFVRFVAAIGA